MERLSGRSVDSTSQDFTDTLVTFGNISTEPAVGTHKAYGEVKLHPYSQ